MQELTDFFPIENSVQLDRDRQLKWSNAAILHAIQYYQEICGIKVAYENILDELRAGTLRAIQALLYGALKAADDRITIKLFGKIYRPANLEQYVLAVASGMSHYMPDSEVLDNGKDLDEEWPDTQAEVKKKKSGQTGDTGSRSVKKRIRTSSHKH